MLFLNRRQLAGALFTLVTIAATITAASARPINRVVVFGDSLSDNGNTSALAGGAYPVAPYAPGRFSNGAVWAEDFASALGVPLTDRAFAGAYTDTRNTASGFLPTAPGMQTVINGYLTTTPTLDPNSLYVVWGGANDLFNDAASASTATPAQNIRSQVNQLIGAGAKQLLVVNLPNLGSTPGGAASGFGTQLNALTALHNTTLASGIASLSAANPTVSIKTLDVNSLFASVIASPSTYGFTNVTSPYVTNNGQPTGTNPTVIGTGSANNYLFWDEIHPTAAAHAFIAQRALALVVPEGSTAGLLALGTSLLSAGIVIRRRRA